MKGGLKNWVNSFTRSYFCRINIISVVSLSRDSQVVHGSSTAPLQVESIEPLWNLGSVFVCPWYWFVHVVTLLSTGAECLSVLLQVNSVEIKNHANERKLRRNIFVLIKEKNYSIRILKIHITVRLGLLFTFQLKVCWCYGYSRYGRVCCTT